MQTKKIKFACKKLFSENVCFSTKFDLQLKKKLKKNLGQFQFWGRHQKMLVI